ncbi:MAG: serine protease, partial [Acidimicrobiia bacterium]
FDPKPPQGIQVLIAFVFLGSGLIAGALCGSRIKRLQVERKSNAIVAAAAWIIGTWLVLVPLQTASGALHDILKGSFALRTVGSVPRPDVLTRPADLLSSLATEYDHGGSSSASGSTTTSSSTSVAVPFPDRPDGMPARAHKLAVASTVRISTVGCLNPHNATGFVVPEGIVTNSHVVQGTTEVQVSTWNGHAFLAKVIAYDEANELALLSNPKSGVREHLNLGTERRGDHAWLYGYGDNATLSTSNVTLRGTAEGPTPGTLDRRFSGVVRRGDSGAPLITHNGRVVGVNWARETDRLNVGRARPATVLRTFLEDKPKGNPTAICESAPQATTGE